MTTAHTMNPRARLLLFGLGSALMSVYILRICQCSYHILYVPAITLHFISQFEPLPRDTLTSESRDVTFHAPNLTSRDAECERMPPSCVVLAHCRACGLWLSRIHPTLMVLLPYSLEFIRSGPLRIRCFREPPGTRFWYLVCCSRLRTQAQRQRRLLPRHRKRCLLRPRYSLAPLEQ